MKRALLATLALTVLSTGAVGAAVNVQQQPGGAFYAAVQPSGSLALKYDLVIVGDGFTAAEQADFNARVDDVVAALQAREPFASHMCAFNIWRVNVVSAESGVDHPKDMIFKNTELDVRYGVPANGEAERCIRSDSPAKVLEAAGYAPEYDAVFVLANDTQWGGCAGQIVYSSISSGFAGIVTHELGHKIGNLADEYTCYVCDGSDANASYVGAEPGKVNCTTATVLGSIKWKDLILPGTPLPTVGGPPGQVGIYEGCMYKARDIYSPESTCHMLTTGSGFCAVCDRKMEAALRAHCTACELAKTPIERALACFDLRLPVTKPPWWEIVNLRWPIPVCLSCPPLDFLDRFDIVIRDLAEEGAIVRIVDDAGNVLATSKAEGLEARTSFTAQRGGAYWLELEHASALLLDALPQVEILVDGQEIALDSAPQVNSGR